MNLNILIKFFSTSVSEAHFIFLKEMSVLRISILTVKLQKKLFSGFDDIRISITCLPLHQKQKFIIKGSKLPNVNHTFYIDTTISKVESIIFTVRRKSKISNDPIIGTVKVDISNIPLDTYVDQYFDYNGLRKKNQKMNGTFSGQLHVQFYHDSQAQPFEVMDFKPIKKAKKFHHHKKNENIPINNQLF